MRKMGKIEQQRLLVVLSTMLINVVAVTLLSLAPWSNWRTGLGLNLIDNAILFTHFIRRRDRLMGHLILFGLFLGFTELMTDAFLVDQTKTLDYSLGGGPMIWRSPIWMPLAWEVVGVQFGYIGLRLVERWNWLGLAMAGILGSLNIPFYEEMALRTHWWRYQNCKMFLHTPYYIIVGEIAIAMMMALGARALREEKLFKTIGVGILLGIGIYACYALPYWLIDVHPWRP